MELEEITLQKSGSAEIVFPDYAKPQPWVWSREF
jgi:hypothetical protein